MLFHVLPKDPYDTELRPDRRPAAGANEIRTRVRRLLAGKER